MSAPRIAASFRVSKPEAFASRGCYRSIWYIAPPSLGMSAFCALGSYGASSLHSGNPSSWSSVEARLGFDPGLGTHTVNLNFDCIFAPDLSRWRAIVMAKSLFWLSDEAWKALSPHLPRGEAGKPRVDDRTVISGITACLEDRLSMARRSVRLWAADNDLQPVQSLVSASRLAAHLREDMAAAGPIPDEAFNRPQPCESASLGERLKKGSLKKRSAARGAEGRAKFMLWLMIAADRSLSRCRQGTSPTSSWPFRFWQRRRKTKARAGGQRPTDAMSDRPAPDG